MVEQEVYAIKSGHGSAMKSFAKAKALGHTSIMAAISALKRGSGDMLRDAALALSKRAIRARNELYDLKLTGVVTKAQVEDLEERAVTAEKAALDAQKALTPWGTPKHCSATLNGTDTADCYCRILGTRRCSMTLFQAYRDKQVDVIHAIRSITGGKSPGPATKFCLSLGPQKCREVMSAAKMHCHHDVISAFKVLQPHSIHSMNAWRNCTVASNYNFYAACPRTDTNKLPCSGNGQCIFNRGSKVQVWCWLGGYRM